MSIVIDAVQELERLYNGLTELFSDEVGRILRENPPIIIVQSRGRRKRALGWHAQSRWRKRGEDDMVHEITLTAEQLHRAPEEIVETLLHEMVHHANALLGIRDHSGAYHNENFKFQASFVGLEVEKGKGGWNKTTLGPRAKEAVKTLVPKMEAFSGFRLEEVSSGSSSRGLKKWGCECSAVWTNKGIAATCVLCGVMFVEKLSKKRGG